MDLPSCMFPMEIATTLRAPNFVRQSTKKHSGFEVNNHRNSPMAENHGHFQRPHCDRTLESWLIRDIIPKWPNNSG